MSKEFTFRKDQNVIVHPGGGSCDIMSLTGKRLVIASTGHREKIDKDKIKSLVGSEQITGRIVG